MGSGSYERVRREELDRILKITNQEMLKYYAPEGLLLAAHLDDVKAAKFFLKPPIRSWALHRPRDESHGPLDWAAIHGHVRVMKVLLRRGVDPNKSNSDYKPLHLATLNKCLPAVRLLLEYGADPTLLDDYGRRPSLFAIGTENHELRRLLKKAEFLWSPETFVDDLPTVVT